MPRLLSPTAIDPLLVMELPPPLPSTEIAVTLSVTTMEPLLVMMLESRSTIAGLVPVEIVPVGWTVTLTASAAALMTPALSVPSQETTLLLAGALLVQAADAGDDARDLPFLGHRVPFEIDRAVDLGQ